MPATPRFFAVNADDAGRAKAFYETVFGWTIRPWRPPNFYIVTVAGVETAALQERHELVPGQRTNAFRITFAVDNTHATLAAVQRSGGKVLMEPYQIEGGPEVAYLEDTEGNIIGIGRYGTPRTPEVPPTLRHFAINADDIARARSFYETVFGWVFTPWGPPNFYQVKNAGDGVTGALQQRRNLIPGTRATTFETTLEVADIRATLDTAARAGGTVVMSPHRIEGVGEIGYLQDTEGNLCGIAQYVPGLWA